MRQSLAIAWVLLALTYININIYKFYVCVIIALFFHTSAILMILLPLVNKLRLSIFLSTSLLLLTFFLGSFNVLVKFISLLGIFDVYRGYTEVLLLPDSSFSLTRLLINLLLIFLLFTVDLNNFYLKVFFIGVIFLNIFSAVPYIARISQYFLISQILLYPTISFIRGKKYGILFRGLLYIYALVVFFFSLNANIAEVVPYKFFN